MLTRKKKILFLWFPNYSFDCLSPLFEKKKLTKNLSLFDSKESMFSSLYWTVGQIRHFSEDVTLSSETSAAEHLEFSPL